jgi:heme/copper-type cytochrome/quinol oxidase subunit 2
VRGGDPSPPVVPNRTARWFVVQSAAVRLHLPHLLLVLVAGAAVLTAQDQGPTTKQFTVNAHRYAFEPMRIEVNQDDLVKIELRTADIAHSLTIDEYRIAKRVGPGQLVTFEFCADRPGTFPYYCNLQGEDGCRQMRGVLVVRPKRSGR